MGNQLEGTVEVYVLCTQPEPLDAFVNPGQTLSCSRRQRNLDMTFTGHMSLHPAIRRNIERKGLLNGCVNGARVGM